MVIGSLIVLVIDHLRSMRLAYSDMQKYGIWDRQHVALIVLLG